MRLEILGAVGLLALAALAGVVEAQSVPAPRVVITVGGIGSDYGYDSGSYGTLVSGAFPGDLFADGNSRAVAGIYEDTDADWHFVYSGGTESGWTADLDDITVTVTYEDGRDTRAFVLGGSSRRPRHAA